MRSQTRRAATLVALATLALGAPVFAQLEPPEADGSGAILSSGMSPAIEFEQTSVDLGKILQSDKPTFTFKFKNTGRGPLTIEKIVPGCGCTATNKVDLEGRTLQPGESAELKSEFDPKGKKNSVVKHITVHTNDPEKPQVMLDFKAFIEPVVITEPDMLNYSSVAKGEQKSQVLTLYGRTADFQITGASIARTEAFDVKILGVEDVVRDGVKFRAAKVEVILRGDKAVGRLNESISVRTNDPNAASVSVAVTGQIVGDIKVEPTTLTFPAAKAGELVEGTFKVANRRNSAFKVEKVEIRYADASAKPLEATFEPVDPGTTAAWSIRLKGVLPTGMTRLTGQVLVTTDVPGETQIAVPFYALIRGANTNAPAAAGK